MTYHRIYIEAPVVEDLLELPEGVSIAAAAMSDGNLVLEVTSEESLGEESLTALYGNIEEDEKQVHLGILEPRSA